MLNRPLFMTDKLGHFRDIVHAASKRVIPSEKRTDVEEGYLANMCLDCQPLGAKCTSCMFLCCLYEIDHCIYHTCSRLSDPVKEQFLDYILQKLTRVTDIKYESDIKYVNDLDYINNIINEYKPLVEFVTLYDCDVAFFNQYDGFIDLYMKGYIEYLHNKYLDSFKKYNVKYNELWYTSIYEITNIYAVLFSILRETGSVNHRKMIDDECEICELKINFMSPNHDGKSNIILELPKCFSINIIKTFSKDYGFDKEGYFPELFMSGCEDPVSDSLEIGDLEKKELFCLYTL